MKHDKKIKRVFSPIDNEEIPFTDEDGEVSFAIPKIECHNTVVIEWE